MINLTPRLVIVVGMSPAVVTETLYELEHGMENSNGFASIDFITTGAGKKKCEQILCSEQGKIREYINLYAAEHRNGNYLLPEFKWHVPTICGEEISSLSTSDEVNRMGDLVISTISSLCSDFTSVIHASIAGGFKHMSFYMGFAMSLFARPQDTLTHTLVPDEYVSKEGWFFPIPGENSQIYCPDIAFLRMRGFLNHSWPNLFDQSRDYNDMIVEVNRYLGPLLPEKVTLTVNLKEESIQIEELDWEPIKVESRYIKLLAGLDYLKEEPLSPKPDVLTSSTEKTYLNQINRILLDAFGFRVQILSTKGHRGRNAMYYLAPGLRIRKK